MFCRTEFEKSFRKGQSISKATRETPRRTFHSNGGAKLENYVIMRDVTSYMKRQKVPVKCEKRSEGEVIEYAANERDGNASGALRFRKKNLTHVDRDIAVLR